MSNNSHRSDDIQVTFIGNIVNGEELSPFKNPRNQAKNLRNQNKNNQNPSIIKSRIEPTP